MIKTYENSEIFGACFHFLCWWICSFTSEIYLPKLEVQPGAKIKTRPVFLLGAT
jgi:hypothetical protein